jgi:uncharacterized SAM-binding protein YcdF (DUF218 family)
MRMPRRDQGRVRLLFLLLALGALSCWLWPERFLAPAGTLLFRDEQPEKGDAIVILLGAESPDRVLRAVELFRGGFAPRIVMGTGFVGENPAGQASLVWPPASLRERRALESLGVTDEQLVLIDTGTAFDTQGELMAVTQYARDHHWEKILLVTSATHSLRASLIWERIAPDLAFRSTPAREEQLAQWWRSPRIVRAVGYEYGALVKELSRRIFGVFFPSAKTN